MAVSVTEVVAMLSVPEAVGGEDDDDDGHDENDHVKDDGGDE